MTHNAEQKTNGPQEKVRVNLNMSRDDYEELKCRARSEGITVAAFLRNTLLMYRWLRFRHKNGASILVEENGYQKEIVFL